MTRTSRLLIAAVASAALTMTMVGLIGPVAPASAAVSRLYANGLLNPVTTASNGTPAPAGYYWSEVQHDPAVPSVENQTGFIVTHGSERRADDFKVPNGQAWVIDSIETFAYVATESPAPFVGATLRIWSGTPGLATSKVVYGDPNTNRLRASEDSLVYRIRDSTGGEATPPGLGRKVYRNIIATPGLVLTGGTYWVDWDAQAAGNADAWSPPVTVPGTRGLPGWNARRAFTGGWGATVDPGLPATGADVAQDFPFNVNGEITYPAPDTRLGHTPRKKIYKRAAGFKFGTDQNAATFQCSLNGSPFAACAKSATFKSRKGKNILSVRAVSAYGVADASPASYRWKYLKKKRR